MPKTTDTIVKKIATTYMQDLAQYGYILPGHNGPYKDPETPVRNTAHAAVVFHYLAQKTGEEKYAHALAQCGEYLLSSAARPMGQTFFCRKNYRRILQTV
ncbi:hypothetical protein [Chitinivibrio alkaliphilus]|uniref:hypothetical protein n=1 Tax=Chitinivibrio alkaliphilus TaxID=1505232 RepID=UPI0012DC88C3|nr:hypothetical protein [Chitinivibrio alkaliphilus]